MMVIKIRKTLAHKHNVVTLFFTAKSFCIFGLHTTFNSVFIDKNYIFSNKFYTFSSAKIKLHT